MKKWIIGLILLNFTVVNAADGIRAEKSITVEDGKVLETGILADEKGIVFLEFLKGSLLNYTKDKQPFSGEILTPSIIDKPEKFPRARMREVLTFELLTDNADEISLIDRYTIMHSKEYLRETLSNPDGLVHNGGIKLLTRIYDKDKIGLPSLWRLETKNNKEREIKYWKKIGGKLNDNVESDVKVFTAVLNKTGIYSIFDENPAPFYSENTPLETVQKVEESPFPSVVPQNTVQPTSEDIPDESGVNDFSLEENTLVIPAIKTTKKLDDPIEKETLIIPAIKTDKKIEEINEKEIIEQPENLMQASIINTPMLPVAGNNASSQFPIVLMIAFLVLGFSIYLAVKKDYT